MILSILAAIAFGLGVSMVLFATTLYYKSFFGEIAFENPLVPMGVSFGLLSLGLALLYDVVA